MTAVAVLVLAVFLAVFLTVEVAAEEVPGSADNRVAIPPAETGVCAGGTVAVFWVAGDSCWLLTGTGAASRSWGNTVKLRPLFRGSSACSFPDRSGYFERSNPMGASQPALAPVMAQALSIAVVRLAEEDPS